jgi:transposase
MRHARCEALGNCNPLAVPAANLRQACAQRDATSANACEIISALLWTGELEAVWMPDERCRMLRRRLARREHLVRSRTRTKNEIHAVLARRLQGKPPCSDLFGVKGPQWPAGLEPGLEERE